MTSLIFSYKARVSTSIFRRTALQIPPFLEDHPTLQCFWDMLMRKCPNLQELSIEGVSSSSQEFTVIRSLLRGRWPQLRKLSFGDVTLDPHLPSDSGVHPFITFLEEHPSLQSVTMSRHSINPMSFSALSPGSLPQVREFQGSLEQLQALPHLHHSLKSVVFSEPMRTREFTPPAVSAVLLNIPNLSNLEISFVLNSMYDSNSLLRTIVLSCPKLKSLSLCCTQKPCFQMVRFSLLTASYLAFTYYITGHVLQDNPGPDRTTLIEFEDYPLSRRRIRLCWCREARTE